jgi:hypothetical protein
MKRTNWYLLVPIISLTALTLACSSITNLGGGGGGGDTAILRDDFSDSSSGWGTGTDLSSSVEYAHDGLQFIVFSDRYITWSNPNTETYSNVHIEVTAMNNSADRLVIYGILCHEQSDQSFYYLGVASDGYYTISKSASGQDDLSLTNGTNAPVPTGSETFTIGADCGNGNLVLYVNGQQVATVLDSSYTSGKIGLFAGSNETPNSVDVTFDDFVVTSLQ